jgi:hypothetical protein
MIRWRLSTLGRRGRRAGTGGVFGAAGLRLGMAIPREVISVFQDITIPDFPQSVGTNSLSMEGSAMFRKSCHFTSHFNFWKLRNYKDSLAQ